MKQKVFSHSVLYLFYYFVVVVISILVGYLVIHVGLIKLFDNFFYVGINSLPHPPLAEKIVWPVNLWFFPNQKIFFLPAFFYFLIGGFFLYLGIFKRSLLLWGVLCIAIGLTFAGLLLEIDWHFIFRHRPFEYLPSTVDKVSRQALMKFPSYPSGHVRDTTVVSTIISRFIPRVTLLMILFVLFIAFTRVYEGAHYPTDVLAGILFGFLIGELTLHFLQFNTSFKEKLNQKAANPHYEKKAKE